MQVVSVFFVRTKDTRQNRGTRKYDEALGDLSVWQTLRPNDARSSGCLRG